MAPNLPRSRVQSQDDLRRLRRLLGWQLLGFDGLMRCGTLLLINLQLAEFVYFSRYVVARLVLPVSSFLFKLLEFYRL
jgi:hypothetical protein